jgi:hypothetical protein
MSSEFDNDVVKTDAEVAAELAMLELEEKRLDLELKREAVAKNRAARSAKLEEARSKLLSIYQFLASRKASQDNCNHRKGGIGREAVMQGQGTDAMYAVIKHQLPNGVWSVTCERCHKEWKGEFRIGSVLIEPAVPSKEEFVQAIAFPTDNSPSRSGQFYFNITPEYAQQLQDEQKKEAAKSKAGAR